MPLRSAHIDGTSRGRPHASPSDLTMLHDGRGVFFTTRARDGCPTFHRMSLDDGEITRLGTLTEDLPFAVAAAAGVLFTSLTPGEIARYDLATGDLERFDHSDVTSVAGCSPDGRFVAVHVGPKLLEIVHADSHAAVAEVSAPSAVAFLESSAVAVALTQQGVARKIDLARGRAEELGRVRGKRVERLADRDRATLAARYLAHRLEATPTDVPSLLEVFAEAETLCDVTAGRALHVGPSSDSHRSFVVHELTSDARSRLDLPATSHERSARLTRDGRGVLVYTSRHFALHDLARGAATTWHDGHDSPITAMTWSRDGALLATREELGTARVCRPDAREVVWSLEGPPGEAAALCFTPDQRTLYLCTAKAFLAWDLATATEVANLPNLRRRARNMTVSDDGAFLAVVGDDHRLRVIDITSTPRCVVTTSDPVTAGPDAQRLHHVAIVGGQSIRCLSTSSVRREVPRELRGRIQNHHARWFDLAGRETARVSLGESTALFVSIDDDLDRVVGVRDDALILAWRVAGDAQTREHSLREGLVDPIPLCAAGGVVVSAEGEDGARALTVRSLVDGDEVARVALTRVCVRGAMAPDGRRFAVAYDDGGVEVFSLDP